MVLTLCKARRQIMNIWSALCFYYTRFLSAHTQHTHKKNMKLELTKIQNSLGTDN